MNKIILSDTSCLIALSNINQLGILKNLFQEIIITEEVEKEFGEPLPDWINIKTVKNKTKQFELEKRLDKGEASSIALALETDNSTLIIDEIKGRKIAEFFHIDIIGTLGVLLLADKKGIIKDFMNVIKGLKSKGFRISDSLFKELNDKYGK
jgi:predicted nucleic acid-binding protein